RPAARCVGRRIRRIEPYGFAELRLSPMMIGLSLKYRAAADEGVGRRGVQGNRALELDQRTVIVAAVVQQPAPTEPGSLAVRMYAESRVEVGGRPVVIATMECSDAGADLGLR